MLKIVFTSKAWEDYLYWQETDKKMLKRINSLIKDIQRSPNETGIGKAEKLNFDLSGFFSRRINQEHRLVYRIQNGSLEIVQLRFHY